MSLTPVLLGLGSNVQRERHLHAGLDALAELLQEAQAHALGLHGLVDWLARAITSASSDDDSQLLRLESDAPLTRSRDGELPSEGMVAGSVQIPPNGQPVLFLRDHAVTGGYPVIATVINEDVDIAAQLPPGGTLRFERYTPEG